jgi:hypothetical protein
VHAASAKLLSDFRGDEVPRAKGVKVHAGEGSGRTTRKGARVGGVEIGLGGEKALGSRGRCAAHGYGAWISAVPSDLRRERRDRLRPHVWAPRAGRQGTDDHALIDAGVSQFPTAITHVSEDGREALRPCSEPEQGRREDQAIIQTESS